MFHDVSTSSECFMLDHSGSSRSARQEVAPTGRQEVADIGTSPVEVVRPELAGRDRLARSAAD
jgi:hypothetical protein